jgi:hypothetical protein
MNGFVVFFYPKSIYYMHMLMLKIMPHLNMQDYCQKMEHETCQIWHIPKMAKSRERKGIPRGTQAIPRHQTDWWDLGHMVGGVHECVYTEDDGWGPTVIEKEKQGTGKGIRGAEQSGNIAKQRFAGTMEG